MIINLFRELINIGYGLGAIIAIIGCILAVVILSLSLHEFAHAYIAHRCGDDTAKINGRMTVNPLKHLDIMGLIMLILLGFGFAKPVPINPYNFRKMRRDYFFVSIAGITVNLILAFVASFLYVVVIVYAKATIFNTILAYFFFYMLIINLGLMLFNLFPIFPLDGFRIIESASGRNNKFVFFMRKYGQFILIGLLAWSFVVDFMCSMVTENVANILQYFDILGFTLSFLINGIANGFMGLWKLFIK